MPLCMSYRISNTVGPLVPPFSANFQQTSPFLNCSPLNAMDKAIIKVQIVYFYISYFGLF